MRFARIAVAILAGFYLVMIWPLAFRRELDWISIVPLIILAGNVAALVWAAWPANRPAAILAQCLTLIATGTNLVSLVAALAIHQPGSREDLKYLASHPLEVVLFFGMLAIPTLIELRTTRGKYRNATTTFAQTY